jgi:hypothetical protein
MLVVANKHASILSYLITISLEFHRVHKGATCLLKRKQVVYYSLNLINISKYALDLFIESFLATKYSLGSCYASISTFMLEVVLKEGFNLLKGLSLKVGQSL